MAETNLNVFVNGVASYLSSCIFPAIVQGMATKGVSVSVEDLLAMTNTPAIRASVPTAGPIVPAMPFTGAVPGMAPAVVPTAGRKTTVTAQPVVGRTCRYQFKRGDNKDMFCGKPTAPGQEFCNACLKNRKNLSKDIAASAIPGAAPGMGAIPGMSGMPPSYGAPMPVAAPASQPGQLTVAPFDEARGLYKEPNHNFIVHQVGDNVVVIGRLDEASNSIVGLTPQEQQTAQAIGLVIQQVPSAPQPVTTAIPSIPAVPTAAVPQGIPSIPAVPTAAVPQGIPAAVPQMFAQPTGQASLPTIQPLAAEATMPTMGSIPSIPQIAM